MNVSELARELGISRVTFYARRKDPRAPKTLDLEAWRAYLAGARLNEPAEKPPAAAGRAAEAYDYVYERARKTALAADILAIELAATQRNAVRKEEVKTMFTEIASVVRGRLLKLRADLPCALVGRSEADIERIVAQKVEHALSALAIPKTFFEPQSRV